MRGLLFRAWLCIGAWLAVYAACVAVGMTDDRAFVAGLLAEWAAYRLVLKGAMDAWIEQGE
jgi:hypothetical protein